jgi:putative N6-adenine-specific DNA methylase
MTESQPLQHGHAHGNPTALEKRIRRHVSGRIRDYFVVTHLGFEDICRRELVALDMDPGGLTVAHGGVLFRGRFVDCQQANLHLRTATRILMRIDAFTATNPRQLRRRCLTIPWELYLPAGLLPDISVSCRRSRLYHTAAIAQSIREGIGQQQKGMFASVRSNFPQTLFARLVDDRITLSLDSSGEPLYKRGLKAGPARAPIRESMAAAMLMVAGYDGRKPLVDPLCGAGSFSLEAAMMAKQVATGVNRSFAFMGWPAFRKDQWAFLKRRAEASAQELNRPRIYASDIDPRACRQLAGTVAGNGLSDAVVVSQKNMFECNGADYGRQPGLVAINPPYGVRIGSTRQAEDLFRRIGQHLIHAFRGWDVALIAPRADMVRRLPFPARRLPMLHGGLRVWLAIGTVP